MSSSQKPRSRAGEPVSSRWTSPATSMLRVKVRLVPTVFTVVLRLIRLTAEIRAPSDTSSAAQLAASPEVRFEEINTLSCTTQHQPPDQALHRGAATEPQEEPDVSNGQAQSKQTGTSSTTSRVSSVISLTAKGHSLRGDAGFIALDCHFGNNAQLDLERDFPHEGSISAQTNGHLPSTSQMWKTDGQLPLDTAGWLHHSPNSDTSAGPSDNSSPNERGHVQHSPTRLTTGGDDRGTTTLFEIGSAATEPEDRQWRELSVDMNTFSKEAPQAMVDKADCIRSTDATSHDENNDSDGPLLPNRRRQTRPSARSPHRAAGPILHLRRGPAHTRWKWA